LFVGGLKPPFTANADCLTCTKAGAPAMRAAGTAGRALDILVENFGRVTGGVVDADLSFRGIDRWVAANGQTLANWSIAPLSLDNVSALSTTSAMWRNASGAPLADGTPRFYRGSWVVPPGKLGDSFLTLFGWGKGQAFINGHNLQRYWGVGPQFSFYVPSQWLTEGRNEVVLFETSHAPANLTVDLRANHTQVG
jgi:beta-galactosidase